MTQNARHEREACYTTKAHTNNRIEEVCRYYYTHACVPNESATQTNLFVRDAIWFAEALIYEESL